jgi:tRNA(Ile)-lysidine synthase
VQLSTAEADAIFAPLKDRGAVLAAVSGGPDSMALLGLLARWGKVPVHAATINHGLRPESDSEAELVAQFASQLGIPHKTLRWQGAKTGAGLQERARMARYQLLLCHANEADCQSILTAHTQDDQAETVLMRMARGSGVAGLAGLRLEQSLAGKRLIRPLLRLPKVRLVAICEANGWPFVLDPSNQNDAFTRVRWRKLMPVLAKEGLDASRLSALAQRAVEAEDALQAAALEAAGQYERGAVRHARPVLLAPFAIAQRAIAILVADQPAPFEPSPDHLPFPEPHLRLDRCEAATRRLQAAFVAGKALRLTLAGKVLSLSKSGMLSVAAEPERKRGRASKPF